MGGIPDDGGGEEPDEFAQEVDTLEHMDMGLMESRIRDNFKDVIKELDLDYLIVDTKSEKKRNGGEIHD
ncbi:hypothetical protein [Methanogenium cariaci]|uniref:hypothetical protein n=1 Tax=Methanogenium cariaci TaxID=2197 RepID=UPI0007840EB9|nr:hypothetical protein [Methanogenium cariaci]